MDRDALLKQITILGFTVMDLHLYLNTHPHDKEALAMYNQAVEEECKVRKEYEAAHGSLTYGQRAEDGWHWSCCPWPWQEAFNFKMTCATVSDAMGHSNSSTWHQPYGEEHL